MRPETVVSQVTLGVVGDHATVGGHVTVQGTVGDHAEVGNHGTV